MYVYVCMYNARYVLVCFQNFDFDNLTHFKVIDRKRRLYIYIGRRSILKYSTLYQVILNINIYSSFFFFCHDKYILIYPSNLYSKLINSCKGTRPTTKSCKWKICTHHFKSLNMLLIQFILLLELQEHDPLVCFRFKYILKRQSSNYKLYTKRFATLINIQSVYQRSTCNVPRNLRKMEEHLSVELYVELSIFEFLSHCRLSRDDLSIIV